MAFKKYRIFNARKFKRLKVNYLIKYQDVNSLGAPLVSNIKDLSAGGVRFYSNQETAQGTYLRLSILIPPMEMTFQALGRVMRVHRAPKLPIYYISVAFLELKSEEQDVLNRFIEDMFTRTSFNKHPDIVTRTTPAAR